MNPTTLRGQAARTARDGFVLLHCGMGVRMNALPGDSRLRGNDVGDGHDVMGVGMTEARMSERNGAGAQRSLWRR